MASAYEEDSPKCPICCESFKHPRKLPKCNHVFCEDCIYETLVKLKNESESGFPCPVCRVLNPCPGNEEIFLNWISTLEMDDDDKSYSTYSENMDLCFPCKKLDKTSRAVKYCLDCRESLCESCFKVKLTFTGFHNHRVVEINGDSVQRKKEWDINRALADYLACPEHPENNITCVCEDDKTLLCLTCALANHRKCSQVTELQHRISKEEAGSDSSKLQDSMAGLITFGQSLIEAIKTYETENKATIENIGRTMQEMRMKINHLFDAMEQNITQECRAIMKKYSILTEPSLQEAQGIINQLGFSSSLLKTIQPRYFDICSSQQTTGSFL